jgi:hypothetical protein
MARKKFFLIVDTETTQTDCVADFGAVICDRHGEIYAECGVLVREFYLDRAAHPLFHYSTGVDPLWGKANLPARYAGYDAMLANGSRMLATVPAVNAWLAKALAKYRPVLTAYNLNFDLGKCRNTGIDLSIFEEKFCLWYASANKWMKTKEYRQFILDGHHFNPPTALGNMSFQTKAEPMAAFVLGDPNMPAEPHTALEDARDYELPILRRLVATSKPAEYMNAPAVTWRDVQVKDWYKPK